MQLVVADTGPINYLVLIGRIELLPILFKSVILPSVVQAELASLHAPAVVQNWVAEVPAWVQVEHVDDQFNYDSSLQGIDKGEQAAITLASKVRADLLLMDDRKAVRIARKKGFRVTGTLGILELAASRGLINLVEAISQLQRTSFRSPQQLLDTLIGRKQ